MIGILGLIIAILILGVLAYKGVGALPLTLLAGAIVIITNQIRPGHRQRIRGDACGQQQQSQRIEARA